RLPRSSYLSAVLRRPDTGPDNFLRQYIADAALDAVGSAGAGSYLRERRDAVSAMSSAVRPLIAYFLSQGRERGLADADFLPWMNAGTPLEHAEILRRLPAADLTAGVPAHIAEAFPLIAEYLSPADSLGDGEYTRYFRAYRRLKAQNRITREFADLAYAYSPKDGVPPRTSPQELLLRPFDDAQTGLLVVDGLGVEYLPLLLGLAGQAGLTAEYTALGYVSLPTESSSNPPDYWHTGGFLPKVMVVDNVAHDGAQRYERTDFAEDFAACLDAFPERILPAVLQGLQRYRRVAVTADHGSSRLAVLAYQNGLCETLPACGKAVDWRYAVADPHQAVPEKMASTIKGEFWAVRGYHRLRYPGGKKNEMHGGATLEELLVPVVVLRAADSKAPAGRAAEPRREQMIDVMDSDI
ncbi:MAG TPA: hypothetical protein H9694_03050, partial [Firmicutes bacterium]|nr:hypothetical protein [Bacillota bacterium]